MPPNTLTGTVGLKVGPVVMETLAKHYFERMRAASDISSSSNLRQDELLYDQAFNIIKTFMATAAKHTVEELQEFSNTRTPSPPWVHVVKITVPLVCCDNAADYLIKALGGEEVAKRVVGGTKWWQVRGLKGVPSEWITAKKDWREAKQRYQARESGSNTAEFAQDNGEYQPEMDEQRCILYFHGGGYYFGSVDQERYSIQRFARKINGRVFAVNYRLCPQYPFPCAIQDAVAAYLYLIRPPEDSKHRPVKPEHIIIMGDSAGGGLSLALLQVIRDSGLPAPASGVLVSPWCDMSHSFPSIHENTATDVIPRYGLSLHKPSTLWPPPPEETTKKIHQTLKSRIRKIARLDTEGRLKTSVGDVGNLSAEDVNLFSQAAGEATAPGTPIDLGATMQLPSAASGDAGKLSLTTGSGEVLEIDQQVQLYAQNNQLGHPLVSSIGAYLGGLPPLFFIASDKEVLRDEVIYTAHKAADPNKYAIKDEMKKLYPMLDGIEKKYGPTKVHLQVYDDCAHVLPVLFAFTTPAKYCFRAIAGFCRHTTGMAKRPALPKLPTTPTTAPTSVLGGLFTDTPEESSLANPNESTMSLGRVEMNKPMDEDYTSDKATKATKKGWSLNGKAWARMNKSQPDLKAGRNTSDVAGPRFDPPQSQSEDAQCAGDNPDMYLGPFAQGVMIRERVSTRGVIRPLEPEGELSAFKVAPEDVGAIPELSIRRYLEGKAKYEKKFSSTTKNIEKERQRNYELAKKEGGRTLSELQAYLTRAENDLQKGVEKERVKDAIPGSWNWAWALDGDERPPPSSIASRRDTAEARRLARIADLNPEGSMGSGNNLWAHLVNFLTVNPDRASPNATLQEAADLGSNESEQQDKPTEEHGPAVPWRSKSVFWRGKFKPKQTSKLRDPPKTPTLTVSSSHPVLETNSPESLSPQD